MPDETMTITFWGVRGTIPSPGRHTCRYGGNTSCVSVEAGNAVLILDAGTGIIPLGKRLIGERKDVFVLVTHLHSDHVIGFPFFAPLHLEGAPVSVFTLPYRGGRWSPLSLLDGCHFPLRPHEIRGEVRLYEETLTEPFRAGPFTVEGIGVTHPGGAFAYRVSLDRHSVVYAPDSELEPLTAPTLTFDAFARFCAGADVLIHDAQYLPEDMKEKAGWGHSTLPRACDLAVAAGVRHFVPFHHDPFRTDDALDAMARLAAGRLAPHGIGCTMAQELAHLSVGDAVEVVPPAVAAEATRP